MNYTAILRGSLNTSGRHIASTLSAMGRTALTPWEPWNISTVLREEYEPLWRVEEFCH